jgi:hypothetical protein
MPDSAVIADVSETLLTVSTDALSTLTPSPPLADGNDLAMPVTTNAPRVTPFPVEVGEAATQRNRPPVQRTLEQPRRIRRVLRRAPRFLSTTFASKILTGRPAAGAKCP